MKKACSAVLALLLCCAMQLGVFGLGSVEVSTVVPGEHEITVIPVEISVTCGNIRYGTHSGAVSGGKSALVEIQMIYYISVER